MSVLLYTCAGVEKLLYHAGLCRDLAGTGSRVRIKHKAFLLLLLLLSPMLPLLGEPRDKRRSLQLTRTGREVVYHTQGTDLTARDITSAPTIAQVQTQISIITAGGPLSRSRSGSIALLCLSVEAAP